MSGIEKHLQKNGVVLMKITRDLVNKKPGDRLPTIFDYTQSFDISRGTVQSVVRMLEENDCVVLNRRGHQGTYIESIDVEKMWTYTGWKRLTGGTELPLNALAAGLATAFCLNMHQRNIPFNFVFMQGSQTRVRALLDNKYDFLIASELTAKLLVSESDEIEVITKVNGCLYADSYSLMFAKDGFDQIEDGMTIAYDPSSIDQTFLTNELTKNKQVNKLELSYINTYESLIDGRADVIVGRNDVAHSNGYNQLFFKEITLANSIIPDAHKLTEAVVVALKSNYGLKQLLQNNIDEKLIREVQQKVISKEMAPNYY